MPESRRRPAGATTAQLRNDIDSGRTGDKAAAVDPSAAPLGADDEAAGRPPSPEAIARARSDEHQLNSATANATEPDLAPDGEMKRGSTAWLGALAGAMAALVVAAVAAFFLR